MPSRIFNADTLNIRINVLNTVLTTDQERSSVAAALREANGDLSLARPSLERDIPELLPRVTLAYELADLSNRFVKQRLHWRATPRRRKRSELGEVSSP